jgi:hypothetical protein
METPFPQALMTGFERVAAWADLLDEINVFPVADGDTGRNLVVSLSPLRQAALGRERITRELLLSARGNSGNIAARFFSGLLMADSVRNLAGAVRQGRDRAWQAVNDPKQGTMLTVFDALAEAVEKGPATFDVPWRERVLRRRRFSPRRSSCLNSKQPASSTPAPWAPSSSWTDFSAFLRETATDSDPLRRSSRIISRSLRPFQRRGKRGAAWIRCSRLKAKSGMISRGFPPSGKASSFSGKGII